MFFLRAALAAGGWGKFGSLAERRRAAGGLAGLVGFFGFQLAKNVALEINAHKKDLFG